MNQQTSLSPYDFSTQREERRRQRTRIYLLYEAFREKFKKGNLNLSYRIGDAFFFQFNGRKSLLPKEVAALKRLMQKKILENRPLKPLKLTKKDALKRLSRPGLELTHAWVKDTTGSLPYFYKCNDGLLAFKGPLSENTGDVGVWDLVPYPPGILLRVAPQGSQSLDKYDEFPKLFRTFFEAEQWGIINGASNVSDVNRAIKNGEIKSLVQVAQALQDRKIAQIADKIVQTQPRPRVILISGPSSSGKTSFSKLLFIQMRLLGLKPETLSLDNYYLPRKQIPSGPDGEPDYEALEALDIDQINEDLLRLVAFEEIRPPIINFKTHRRRPGSPLKLDEDGILIVEGIHGLNPGLTPHLTAPSVFKIFVSALNHLNLDELNRVSTTDLRLLRRLVRDKRSRGYSVEDTLSRWKSVRNGEQKYIFPFQEEADAMFNSALPFELNALKPIAIKILKNVSSIENRREAKRLTGLMDSVTAISPTWSVTHIRPTSIFREFFGGSLLVD